MSVIYNFSKNDTQTGLFDAESLYIEIRSSSVQGLEQITMSGGDFLLWFANSLDSAQMDALTAVVNAHDGSPSRTTESLQQKRELILSKMVDMAHNHPILKQESTINQTGPDVISNSLHLK